MKTDYLHVHFTDTRPWWSCHAHPARDYLGFCEIQPKGNWKFFSADQTAFTSDSLNDIAHFLNQLGNSNLPASQAPVLAKP